MINRTLTPLLQNKTPYTFLYAKPIDYQFLKVFGSLCFASTLTSRINKFSPRAKACVFVSYSPGIKGYKVYDIVSKHFFFSRDLICHETIFPFHNVSISSDTTSDSFSDLVLPKPPSYLQDFHYNLLTNSLVPPTNSIYPITSFLSYSSFSPSRASFLCNISSTFEPQFYHQAVKFDHWRDAMAKELEAMELNNTWTVLPLPKDKHVIGCKWIYKVKYKSDGSIERYKARLVAKGYTQQEMAWIL